MKSWSDAQSNCNAIAPAGKIGDLASVPDNETNIFLSTITSDTLWIGGYLDSEKQWSWLDKSNWTFDAFAPGQPNDENQKHLSFNFKFPGGWNDAYGNIKYGYICQYTDPPPPPPGKY